MAVIFMLVSVSAHFLATWWKSWKGGLIAALTGVILLFGSVLVLYGLGEPGPRGQFYGVGFGLAMAALFSGVWLVAGLLGAGMGFLMRRYIRSFETHE